MVPLLQIKMSAIANFLILLIGFIALTITIWIAVKRVHRAKYADQITFIKGKNQVTISKNQDISTQRKELVNL